MLQTIIGKFLFFGDGHDKNLHSNGFKMTKVTLKMPDIGLVKREPEKTVTPVNLLVKTGASPFSAKPYPLDLNSGSNVTQDKLPSVHEAFKRAKPIARKTLYLLKKGIVVGIFLSIAFRLNVYFGSPLYHLPLQSVLNISYQHIVPQNKKELVLIAPSLSEDKTRGDEVKEKQFMYPGAQVKAGWGIGTIDGIVSEVCHAAQTRGTLDSVVINAHGRPNELQLISGKPTVSMKDLLQALLIAQKEMGFKLSEEFVFAGCNTLAALQPQDVVDYAKMAKELNANIVGTLNLLINIPSSIASSSRPPVYFPDARFCCFSPDGQISENSRSSTSLSRRLFPDSRDEGSSWFNSMNGKRIEIKESPNTPEKQVKIIDSKLRNS